MCILYGCTFIGTYPCIHIHTYICAYIYAHTYLSIYTWTHTYVITYTHIYVHIYNLMHKEWKPFPMGRVPDWEARDLIVDLALTVMGRVTLSRSLFLSGPHPLISPFFLQNCFSAQQPEWSFENNSPLVKNLWQFPRLSEWKPLFPDDLYKSFWGPRAVLPCRTFYSNGMF